MKHRFACELFGTFPPYDHGHHGHHGPMGRHHGHKHHGHHHMKHHHGHHMKHHHGHHKGHRHFGYPGHGKGRGHFGHYGHGKGHGPFGHGPFAFGPIGQYKQFGYFRHGPCGGPVMDKGDVENLNKTAWKDCWKMKYKSCCRKNKEQDTQTNEAGTQTVLVQRFVVDRSPRCYSV